MSGRIFYRVNRVSEIGGICIEKLLPLIIEGRVIRWRSTGAEYGLFEAVVCHGMGEVNVRDECTGRSGEIFLEQVAEVCLTPDEARQFGFGVPE